MRSSQFLLDKAIEWLDTDKLTIGWPLVEYLHAWIQSCRSMPVLDEYITLRMNYLAQVVVKRLAYPAWCEVEVDPDDDQQNYIKYRELLKLLFTNLALVKPIHAQLLQLIDETLSNTDVSKVPFRQAEVGLLLVHEIWSSIKGNERD